MNIEDVKIGTKVRVISTETTDNYSIYDGSKMLGVGGVSVVNRIEGKIVLLRDGHWYAIKDLQLYEKLPKVTVPEKEIAKLTVSLATEDILKVVLQELYVGIENLSKDLDEDELSGDVTHKESLVTEQDVLYNLLYCINSAVNNNEGDNALKLSEAYQRIKSVSISTVRSK